MNRKHVLWICLALFALPALAADPAPLTSDKDRRSYAIGVDIAKRIQLGGVELDAAALARGINDVLTQKPLALTDEEQRTVLTSYQAEVTAKRSAAAAQVGDANR